MLPAHCICSRLRRSARALTALYDEALAPAGLSTPQFALLRDLQRLGPAPISALAAATAHDRTTINRTLRPLESDGLIRSGTGSDQRMRIVSLTEAGESALAVAHPLWEALQRRLTATLDPELPQLFTLLDRIEEIRA